MRWRLLLSPPASGVDNMATDDALLARARGVDEGVVRVYSWSAPTLSIGRNQDAAAAFDPATLAVAGMPVVRRPTGGRALLHWREITYSVTAPAVPTARPREQYAAINALLVRALQSVGVPADLAALSGRGPRPGHGPCFERPAPGELVIGPRKLAGSAQYREEGAFLQHGSILVHDDQPLLHTLSRLPLGDIPPAATVYESLGRELSAEEFAHVLFAAVRSGWDSAAEDFQPDDRLEEDLAAARVRYASADWTWRR